MSDFPARSSWVFSPASEPSVSAPSPQSPESHPRRRRVVTWLVGLALIGVGIQTLGVLWRDRATTEVVAPESSEVSEGPDGAVGDLLPGGGSRVLGESLPNPESASPQPSLVVHVVGAVTRPGVVELPPGSRIADALERVGGASLEADLSQVNLARMVQDGEQIRVPAVGEENSVLGNEPGSTGVDSPRLVSLSSADAATLESLPGIGPVLAQRIVDWGRENGGFRALEDVLAVPGIGPSTLDLFRHLVTP